MYAMCGENRLDIGGLKRGKSHRAHARADGVEQGALAGRYHDDNRVAGRLFERLQQRVLRGFTEHLGIVDNRHANRGARRPDSQPRNQVADLVDQDFGTAGRA